jgi:succinate dehydrogenase/fumarate reductase flavoprotein subunit
MVKQTRICAHCGKTYSSSPFPLLNNPIQHTTVWKSPIDNNYLSNKKFEQLRAEYTISEIDPSVSSMRERLYKLDNDYKKIVKENEALKIENKQLKSIINNSHNPALSNKSAISRFSNVDLP